MEGQRKKQNLAAHKKDIFDFKSGDRRREKDTGVNIATLKH